MTAFFNTGLTQQQFLEQYWQKKPLLIRQAFPGFKSPITPDELAGLAYEAEIESRLIIEKGIEADWQVRHGPFTDDDFASLPKSHWTLLVQDVDKHLPETQSLLTPFNFIPNWRRDDLMISYAPIHGSVGPHIDGYDVFLLQGLGNRHWQVTEAMLDKPELLKDIDLQILAEFKFEHDWVLEPGDMLYLPPHFGHHGVALNDCMTFSIGFRAPKQAEAMDAVLNELLEQGLAKQHYSDPNLQPVQHGHEIGAQALDNLKQLLHQTIDDADPYLVTILGKLVTETKRSLENITDELLSEPITKNEIAVQFQRGNHLLKSPYHRFAWSEQGAGGQIFVAGEVYQLTQCSRENLIMLTDNSAINELNWQQLSVAPEAISVLCELITEGAWHWSTAED